MATPGAIPPRRPAHGLCSTVLVTEAPFVDVDADCSKPARLMLRININERRFGYQHGRAKPMSWPPWRDRPGCRHSASARAFTPVVDGLRTRVNALMASPGHAHS